MELMNRKNYKKIYIILSVLVVGVVISALFYNAERRDKQIMNDTQYTIMRETKQIRQCVDSSIGYAFNSIKVTASEISKRITVDELEDPTDMIAELLPNTPFTSIEYITRDGINTTDAGEHFDARNREYYMKGISGKSGIWVNYTPRYSNEPLLNFYTPLIYKDTIIGVITGTLGGDTSMSPLLMSDYLEQPVVSVLLDESDNIITFSPSDENTTEFSCESVHILQNHKEEFSEIFSKGEDTVIELNCTDGMGVGYLSIVPSTGWKLIEIVPSNSLNVIKYQNDRFSYTMLITVILVFIGYFSFIIIMTSKIFSKDIQRVNEEKEEQFNILKSMSDMYYSMHVINLTDNTVDEYSSRNEVKDIVNKKDDADIQMRAIMTASVEDEYLDRVLKFSDLTTVSGRMKDKKNISCDFVTKNYGWIRGEFVAIEENQQTGCPDKVVFTTKIIEEEKRREEELKLLSFTDGLTGLLNKRAYIEDVARKDRQGFEPTLVYLAIDINGLKWVNDNLGHEAGDELIKGVADCLKCCFDKYGSVYRTGGDEMVVIFNTKKLQLDEIKSDFEKTVACWAGKLVNRLSVACGYVCYEEYPDKLTSELANIADRRMYEAKAEYYKKKENDRRKA